METVNPSDDKYCSLLCSECSSKVDHLTGPPANLEFHQSISSRARAGYNLPVSIEEYPQINAFLAEVPGKLDIYDHAIAEAENLLRNLKKARDDLLRRAENARFLISAPIRKLPPEILNHIFTFSCWQHGYNLVLRKESHRSNIISCPALVLAHVCSLWRDIVYSRSDLWSSFRLSSSLFRSKPRAFRILMKYISCSAGNPLDFHYEVDADATGHFDPTATDHVIYILFDYSDRWRQATLSFKVSFQKIERWAFFVARRLRSTIPIQFHFPSLEYLDASPFPPHKLLQLLSPCPRLQTVHGSIWLRLSDLPDFSHVTEMSLSSFIGKSLGHLLRRLPALERLAVRNYKHADVGDDDLWLQQTPFCISSLSELTVGPQVFDMEAWRFLRLPSLIHLSITVKSLSDSIESGFRHISLVLADSECQLQTLEVEFDHSEQQVLLDFVAPLSSLVKLSVTLPNSRAMISFMQHLKARQDDSCIVPNIRSLKLRSLAPLPDPDRPLIPLNVCEIVEARSQVAGFSVSVQFAETGL